MKKLRIISIFLLILIISSLTACSIVPYRFQWAISSVECDVTYSNGNTFKTSLSGQSINLFNLTVIHSETTYIKFFEDGTLVFKPIYSEEMKGSYKCKNNGIENTTIYITLENGDNIEALGVGSFYEDIVRFEYNNIEYEFSADNYDICESQEEFNKQLKLLAEELRYYEENSKYYSFLTPCIIKLNESSEAKLISDDGEIDLYAENLGVIAIRVTDNNEIVYLDSIKAGECYYYGNFHEDANSIINIFYFDPLPKHEEENPIDYSLFDIIPELKAFYNDDTKQNVVIKMSHELVNIDPGFNHSYNLITEQYTITQILDILANTSVYEVDAPNDELLNELYVLETISIIDTSGVLDEIEISRIDDRIKIGDKWYYHYGDFPQFIYEGSYCRFTANDYTAEVYRGEEFLGKTDILYNLEYIIDPNQDYSYSFSHDARTLACEFGEITIYDETHFWYKGQFYLSVGERSFAELFEI